ncbi:hypothetical protein LO80_08845 [Candidatus Francisella endociliophora]|uniref:N-acetyltransferase domain-containing protein n=1 Tax=Candidatus Francisella endociliophora TaxID=653937 RepID=A0A097ER82_9GAMM|nr:GNAT family N-acetyltransferase [Francisella sp. FSC1006]AIT10064.1 hypothetical protein LO80_08845 [Francisella sp. FSC1006]
MILRGAYEKDFDQMIDVWEASVRATHDFLTEKDILSLRKLIRSEIFYLGDIDIKVFEKGNEILGFIGTANNNIEMLFIAPSYFGKGIGKYLLVHAIRDKKCTKVEVNEQNPRALNFYQKYGFVVKSRSEVDHQGNPFPILYLELNNA